MKFFSLFFLSICIHSQWNDLPPKLLLSANVIQIVSFSFCTIFLTIFFYFFTFSYRIVFPFWLAANVVSRYFFFSSICDFAIRNVNKLNFIHEHSRQIRLIKESCSIRYKIKQVQPQKKKKTKKKQQKFLTPFYANGKHLL